MKLTSIDRKILRCQREIEAARKPSMEDACAAFLVNTAVNIGGGIYTFLTEDDCRQIKGAAKPASREVAPIGRPAEAAPPSVQKFKPGDRVRVNEAACKRAPEFVGKEYTIQRIDADGGCYVDDLLFFWDNNIELISPASETETEGWVKHDGSAAAPIPAGTFYQYRWANFGEQVFPSKAPYEVVQEPGLESAWTCVTHYRVVKPS